MLKALMALLVVFKLIDTSSQTYYIFNFFADAAFYFLPILIAFCEAKKLKCNPILAATVAGIMMHPNWISLVSAGEAVKFFEVIPFRLVNYSGTVIPIILVILVQAQVEKLLNRIIPKSVNLVFVPMLTFLVIGTLAMAVVGPIGNFPGQLPGHLLHLPERERKLGTRRPDRRVPAPDGHVRPAQRRGTSGRHADVPAGL